MDATMQLLNRACDWIITTLGGTPPHVADRLREKHDFWHAEAQAKEREILEGRKAAELVKEETRQLRSEPIVEDVADLMDPIKAATFEAKKAENIKGNRAAFQLSTNLNRDLRRMICGGVVALHDLDTHGYLKIESNAGRHDFDLVLDRLLRAGGTHSLDFAREVAKQPDQQLVDPAELEARRRTDG